MSRASGALKRLGVAAVGALVVVTGVPMLGGTAAANHVTTVTLTPEAQIGQVNTCNPFTVSVAPAQSTIVDVQLQQASSAASGPAPANTGVAFCTLPANTSPSQQPAPGSTTTTNTQGTVVTTNPGPACNAPAGQQTSGSTTTSTCNAEFTTNNNGQVTFGVTSSTINPVTITAYVEDTQNPAIPGAATGNNVPNTGEPQDASTLFVVQSAQQAVTRLSCTPENSTNQAGTAADFVCTAFGNNPTAGTTGTVPVNGAQVRYVVTAGPDQTQTPVLCSTPDAINPALPAPPAGSTGPTNANGQSVCRVQNNNTPGTDNVLFYIEQNGAAGPQNTEPSDTSTARFFGAARNITCEPKTATNPVGTEHRINCRVTDVQGNPVQSTADNTNNNDQFVRFTLNGVGRILNGNCFFNSSGNQCFVATDTNGVASLFIRSDENGTSTVVGEIAQFGNNNALASDNPNSECRQPAGQSTSNVNATGVRAGNCSDTVTKTWGTGTPASPTAAPTASATPTATSSPTTQPTGTATPRPTGTGTAPGCDVVASVRLERTTITATGSTGVEVRTTPNSVVDLFAYSRPSTTFRVVRSAEVGADGVAQFRIVPPTNTRLYAQQRGCAAGPQVVLNVRTQLSLNVERNGTRNYTFSGRALPARNGGLIVSLYRVTNDGRQILTAQTRANASDGRYVINRVFTGTGRFGFVVRTGQDLQNAPGASNVRSLLVF